MAAGAAFRALSFSLSSALLTAACSGPNPPRSEFPAATIQSIDAPRWEPRRLDPVARAKFDLLVPELDSFFAKEQRESGAPGMAIGIVLGGELVYAKGFGLRDVARGGRFDADTPFPIASVTKGFTAMAILKLRDQGRVDLDGPAEHYYPPVARVAYPTRDAPKITLRHLLTHSSGLPEDNAWADVTEHLTEPDLARILDGALMSRVPGVHFEYSNLGWAILGRVIERVTGQSAREYIQREILTPLGMTHTGWEAGAFPSGTVAFGYRGKDGARDLDAPRVVAPLEDLGIWDVTGGLWTTTRDLARYVSYQLDAWPPRDDPERGPLSRSSVREMQQGQRPFDGKEILGQLVTASPPPLARAAGGRVLFHSPAYGFGLNSRRTCEEDLYVDHAGGLPGYQTFMTMLPDEGFGMIVFVNDERSRANPIEWTIRRFREAGVFVRPRISPAPGLEAAPSALLKLLNQWDDAGAKSLFEDSFFRVEPIARLEDEFKRLHRDHGACRLDGDARYANRLRGRWHVACDRGGIVFAVALAPGKTPRAQALEFREELPATPELDRAARALISLLAQWDAGAASSLLSPANTSSIKLSISKLSDAHQDCKLGPLLDSDGTLDATYELLCKDRRLDLSITVDASGHITSAAAHPARSPDDPNCAD